MASITTCIVVGDSFGNEFGEYPYLLDITAENYCVAGDRLILDIEPTYATDVANRLTTTTIAVIQGGVNDILNAEVLGDIQTALTSCVTTAKAAGLDVVVVNIGPWKNYVGWSAGEQTTTDNYNAWLATQDSVQGFTLVDIYTALESGSSADELDASYDSGDGLHPNAAGSAVVAGLINTAMTPFITTEAAVSNVYEAWRGAIEPAETGGSGNELSLYRGAVEPAYTAPTNKFGSLYYAAVGRATRPSRAPRGLRERRGGLRDM